MVNVSTYNLAKNYWCDAAGTMRVLPDRTASGARVDGEATQFVPNEDPSDYDSPDEYADAAEDEFATHGSSNPWQEAFDYWESCMGWGWQALLANGLKVLSAQSDILGPADTSRLVFS